MNPRVVGLLSAVISLAASGTTLAQADCGLPVHYPAGATCSGGSADGRPCYVFDAGDSYGCPGGICIPSSGGGRATYYTAGTGACGIPVSDPGAMVTAVAEHLWEGSAVCGRCARVTGPLGTVVVEITDLCPVAGNEQWCGGDAAHLDLSEAAFAAIADPNRGVTFVDWEIVECPVGDTTVTLRNKDGINQWWYAVFALDHRLGVSTLEIRDSSAASWISAERQSYNAFVVTSGTGFILPFSVRLSDVAGQVLVAEDVITDLGDFSEFDLGSQLPPCALFADGFESSDTTAWTLSVQ
jgi:expansin (peptidoglycan-binding protein)